MNVKPGARLPALAAQHIGRVARAYRRHSEFAARYGRDGVSQELLGTWLGLTQAQVSRIENGPPVRNLDALAHWARVLQIPPHLLWFKLPPENAPSLRRLRRCQQRSPTVCQLPIVRNMTRTPWP